MQENQEACRSFKDIMSFNASLPIWHWCHTPWQWQLISLLMNLSDVMKNSDFVSVFLLNKESYYFLLWYFSSPECYLRAKTKLCELFIQNILSIIEMSRDKCLGHWWKVKNLRQNKKFELPFFIWSQVSHKKYNSNFY